MSRPHIAETPHSGDGGKAFLLGLYIGLALLLLISHLDAARASTLHKSTNIYGIQAVAGAALGGWRIWRWADNHRRTPALASVWICLGLASWAIGQGLWTLGTFRVGEVPYPWWSDIPLIASVVCWLVALFKVFKSLRRRVLNEIRPLTATVTAGLSLALGGFVWMDRTLIDAPLNSTTLSTLGCDLAYILLNFLSIILAVALVGGNNANIPSPVHQCVRYLMAATTVETVATLSFVVTTKIQKGEPLAYFNGNWVDLLLLTAMYYWGVSALKCPIRVKELQYVFGASGKSGVRAKDVYRASEIAEICSRTADDNEQIIIDSDSIRWVLDTIPEVGRQKWTPCVTFTPPGAVA